MSELPGTRLFGMVIPEGFLDSLGVTSSTTDREGVEHWPDDDSAGCVCGWQPTFGGAPDWKTHALWLLSGADRVEARCPSCWKLIMSASHDFAGRLIVQPCPRCKTGAIALGTASHDDERIECVCGKWLATGVVTAGAATISCRSKDGLIDLLPGPKVVPREPRYVARRHAASRAASRPDRRRLAKADSDQQIVDLIQSAWDQRRTDRAWRSAFLAVGLRYDVFKRDGFRCVYCGRGPRDGALLEADHVIARSLGGADTLSNLVTSCKECNLGKSNKPFGLDGGLARS